MEDFNLFVGGISGVFKGLNASSKGIRNTTNLQALKEITHRNEVTVLNWGDTLENEILIGYNNQLVKIYDLNKNAFSFEEEKKLGEGPIRGIFRINKSLVTAVQSGLVKVWDENETVINTGNNLTCMRQSPEEENIMGTGGMENELKLWDLETGKTTFQAKNVRHDELELRQPVWVMGLAFMSNSKKVAIASRYGHVRMYDPSTPTRRPVCQVTIKDQALTCIAPAPRENHVVVGCGTGNIFLVDLRGKGVLLNKYKGFMGGVRQVMCPTVEPYIVSVSLDRHLRIHHLDTKKLLFSQYMQSRLSALLLKSTFTMAEIKEEVQEIKEEIEETNENEIDEEYEQLFNDMEVITEKGSVKSNKIKARRKKSNVIDNESEAEHEELFNDMEEISEKQNISEKRTKSKVKTKAKRLKKLDSEIIVVS